MPRRPSASVGPSNATTPNASSILVHRATESHHAFMATPIATQHHHSLQTLGASATPQQKIVQVLVNRLKNKLPCNSGLSLDRVESDQPTQQAIETLVELSRDSLDMIAWALSELLDRLAKQTDSHTGHLAIDVLQSQLFILKVLSMTMASRWSKNPQSSSQTTTSMSDNRYPDSPGAGKNSRSAPSIHSTTSSAWQEPPPLDDACVKYVLSVMVLFMRQTSSSELPLMLQTRSTDISFRDFEDNVNLPASEPSPSQPPPPQEAHLRSQPSSNSFKSSKMSIKSTLHIAATNTAYEKTHMSLVKSSLSVNNLIAKHVGRIIFHISASNWNIVLDRLSTKIGFLAKHPEVAPDIVDLQLMSHSVLDRHRLVLLLNQLSSLLVNMRREAQVAIAVHLRSAVWNWIDIFPEEFNDAIRNRGRTEGSPERVFDLLYSMIPNSSERIFWPTLSILNCITVDRISADLHHGTGNLKGRKELRFTDTVLRQVNSTYSRLSEIALACAVDMCRAAAYVSPDGEVPLRLVASDIAHEIKGSLYNWGPNRKPFWDSHEDIDVALYADALVAIYRFLPDEDAITLFQQCMEPERSDPVKTCAIRACLTLVQDAPRFSWQKSFERLAVTTAPRCRDILRSAGLRRLEIDQYGNTKRAATRPRARRVYPEPLSDREVLILGILSLWRSTPLFFIKGIETRDDVDNWVASAVKLWEAPIDISVKISTSSTMRKVSELTFLTDSTDPSYKIMTEIVKSALPRTLISVVANLLTTRTDVEAQRLWISIAHQVMEVYVAKIDLPHVKNVQSDPDRIPGFALMEIAFLVALTSADNGISQLAAKGLRLLSHAERQPNAPSNDSISDEDRSKRNPVYEQLGDPRITVVGRLGHQKRIRKLIRMLSFSAGIHLVVWEECYWRWRALNESITNFIEEMAAEGVDAMRGSIPLSQQEIRFQWQNLTMFLAALSGSCMQDNPDLTALSRIVPAKLLPDQMRVVQNPVPLIETFIGDLINLLTVPDIQTRDLVRDALGSELSPKLYSRLIRNLEETVRLLKENSHTNDIEGFALVLEQVITILKLIAENPNVGIEDVMSVDMSATMVTLASFIGGCEGPSLHRIRIKFCVLCEAVCSRQDNLNIRRDSSARHEILDYVLQWMTLPSMNGDYVPSQSTNDLNMACLRASVKLLDRLHLRQGEQQANTGDESIHVSRLFNKYSSALLKSIEASPDYSKIRVSQKEAELRELVITGLTHLVTANSESGFKQCLPLAYDKDNRKRMIFAHVFARVIGQGTVFDPEDKSIVKSRYSALCDLVRGSDMVLAMAICEICPPGEVEMIVSVLLNIFDSRQSLMALIRMMIEREVEQTPNEAGLFRSNSTYTRFLSAFARLHGYNYLRSLVQPLIDTMANMPPGTSYEVDPTRVAPEDIQRNKEDVEFVATKFLQLMASSLPILPGMFREICAHIAKVVSEVWPDSKYAAMANHRFISPAVVTPENIDIVIPRGENSATLRRGLMVIAKIIQNLANNLFFGKEAFMTIFNPFLESNITNVTRFLSEMHVSVPLNSGKSLPGSHTKKNANVENDGDLWLGTTSDDTDVAVLHRFFHKHADKIGKELLSLSKPSVDGDTSAITGKRAWDALCALLVDLGPPLDVPRLSTLNSNDHRDYLLFMKKYNQKSTKSVEDLFQVLGVENVTVFCLSLSKIKVEGLDIELLMYHILKTLTSESFRERPFDIILDCTAFTTASEVPLQWLKYCAEMIPADIRNRFSCARILNPNGLTQKYLRRLYNISAGSQFAGEIKAYSSFAQLADDVNLNLSALSPLVNPYFSEQEPFENFGDVTMKAILKIPVTLRVGTTHLRVTSVKSLPISPGFSCCSVELIPLADVSDIYNIAMGSDPHEFIIRRRQGVTVYFSSPSRDSIIKTIRSAKGRLKDAPAPLTERFSRFSNVPATLLHIGLLSVDLNDEELRGAAYDLLGAVCNYLKYDKSPIVACKAGFISGDPVAFVSHLSEKLADYAPQLTLDFIHEVSAAMTSMDKSAIAQRISCLQYMGPWIQNLSHFANPTHSLFERSGARLRDCIRTLADLSITSTIQRHIWAEVAKLDSNVVNIILDELIRTATDGGVGTRRCETISHIVGALSSINVRGRIYSKLRKALSKVSVKLSNTLMEYTNWNEISTLIRLALVVGSQSTQAGQNYLYVPEIMHLVSLTAGEGPSLVRKSVYGIVVNLLQSLYMSRPDDTTESGLMELITECTLPEVLKLFGLQRETPTSEYVNLDPLGDKETLDTQEKLVQFLIRIMNVSSGSTGLLNVWRARWLGLVTAAAFQQSPAVQTRSFVALAALAVTEVDDDFLYQILVAFKTALAKASEHSTIAVVSMLRCLCRIVPAIIIPSRYINVLFWLAVALLEASHLGFYVEATWLLRVTLENMEKNGAFNEMSVQDALMEARAHLEEVLSQLDELLRLSFDTSFSFSLASIIFKGMRHSGLKESAEAVLRTLLRVTSWANTEKGGSDGGRYVPNPEALGYFLALFPVSTTPKSYKRLVQESNIDESWLSDVGLSDVETDDSSIPRLTPEALGITDSNTALLAASFAGTILSSAQGDDAETEILYGLLSSLANSYPEIISITYDSMQDRIRETFANSSNASIIRSVSNIFRIALQDPSRSSGSSSNHHGSTSTLSTVEEQSIGPGRSHLNALDELSMQGLANNFQFLPPNRGHATIMINWIPSLVQHMIS
ncbi:hypothetical protein CVT24_011867 [Panaeolus cyanescens]|uniref:Ras-GAP domain-containing protein n=1 Tax=Panaeolus cyanescens TaxID=181874 RepID=A0A409YNK3_9AGAR|nr:hypothetical protein CVT24_011867 [Panaeolus cyanescens]